VISCNFSEAKYKRSFSFVMGFPVAASISSKVILEYLQYALKPDVDIDISGGKKKVKFDDASNPTVNQHHP